jgi:hypothetical protein
VNPQLEETGTTMCFKCRAPLTAEDRKHELYVYEKSCQFCDAKKKRFHTPPGTQINLPQEKEEKKSKKDSSNNNKKKNNNNKKNGAGLQNNDEQGEGSKEAEVGEEGAALGETTNSCEVMGASSEPVSKKMKA